MAKKQKIHYGNATMKQREYIEKRIYSDLALCQSSLVDALMKSEEGQRMGFDVENIENEYESWTTGKKGTCEHCEAKTVLHADYDCCEKCWEANEKQEHPQEIFEWWALPNSFIADELRKIKEPILDNDYGTWWGRTCTGQAVALDPTFWVIFQDAFCQESNL